MGCCVTPEADVEGPGRKAHADLTTCVARDGQIDITAGRHTGIPGRRADTQVCLLGATGCLPNQPRSSNEGKIVTNTLIS